MIENTEKNPHKTEKNCKAHENYRGYRIQRTTNKKWGIVCFDASALPEDTRYSAVEYKFTDERKGWKSARGNSQKNDRGTFTTVEPRHFRNDIGTVIQSISECRTVYRNR